MQAMIAALATPQVDFAASVASRQLMWNMTMASYILMYALAAVAFAVFGYGIARRIRSWRHGKPAGETFADWGRRFWILIRETFLQQQTRRRFVPGLFHAFIFYSFLILFATTLVVMADMDFGTHIYHGSIYLAFTLAADIAGAALLVGLAIAAVRRYLARPRTLPENRPVDAWVLIILGGIVATGFIAEGARIATAGDPWRNYSPVGLLFSHLFTGASEATGRGVHFATWWFHALSTFALIALIPYTKFFHMLSIPTNQFLSKIAPKGSLQRVDIEALLAASDTDDEFAIGLAEPRHLTWKQRLDLDACIDCGRCDDVCPANAVGQPLSPRRLVKDLGVLAGRADAASSSIVGAEGTVFADGNFIWHCRTCHACQSICPAGIRHVDHFIELRRAQVLMEGRLPADAGRSLKMMEAQGNPFGSQADRLDFIAKLEIPVVGPGEETDILYWIGCTTTFDPEKQGVAQDLVAIMRHLGVRFGHLGRDETCCGDPARVLGEENLFQSTARQVIAALAQRKFKQLLVTCPHGYNVFKNEYPQFGGNFTVVHHSELLAEWIDSGRLALTKPVAAKAVFHDPCYLGRYQGIFAPPRRALRGVPGLALHNMRRQRDNSFCCGAGGGHYWMDLEVGEAERVNNARVREAAACGADTIAVGCPMCMQMLVDGVKQTDLDAALRVRDIASIVREAAGI